VSDTPQKLTHLDAEGQLQMVDVGLKVDTERVAVAEGWVRLNATAFGAIRDGNVKKGDVLTVAQIAGILGAKRTSDLIPLCHPLPLTHIEVQVTLDETQSAIRIQATARTTGKTGVEMEALTAVSVAALTVYDMAKALDRTMHIEGIRLLEKQGGKSGHFIAE
jgi:cyclic pyranopterin monophosphate synthase